MSDESKSPIPFELVQHINRSKSGKTSLVLSLDISTRARLARMSLDLGCSQASLVRASLIQFLEHHEQSRRAGQELAYGAVEAAPVAFPVAVPPVTSEATQAVPEPTAVLPLPPVKSRGKKGGRA